MSISNSIDLVKNLAKSFMEIALKIRVIIFSIIVLYLIYLKWIISFLLPQSLYFEKSILNIIICIILLLFLVILIQYRYISRKIYLELKKHDSAYYREWFTEYPEFTGLKLKMWKLYLGNVSGKGYREKFRNRNVDIYGPGIPRFPEDKDYMEEFEEYLEPVKRYDDAYNSAKKRFPQSKIMLKLIKSFIPLRGFQKILLRINKILKCIEMYFKNKFFYVEKFIRIKFLNRLHLNILLGFGTARFVTIIVNRIYNLERHYGISIPVSSATVFIVLPMSLIILSLILDIFILQELYYIYLCAPLYLIVKFYEYYIFLFSVKSYKWLKELKTGVEVKLIKIKKNGKRKGEVEIMDFLAYYETYFRRMGISYRVPKSVIIFKENSITNYNDLIDPIHEKFLKNPFRTYKPYQPYGTYKRYQTSYGDALAYTFCLNDQGRYFPLDHWKFMTILEYYQDFYDSMLNKSEMKKKVLSEMQILLLIVLSAGCIQILLGHLFVLILMIIIVKLLVNIKNLKK
jgi:hypothetical protein